MSVANSTLGDAGENLFSVALPQMPIAWDSTMLGLLKECPRKFQYTILEGWQSSGFAAHLEFGIAYHKVLENYDIARVNGADHEDALLGAVAFCMSYGYRDDGGKFHPYDAMFTREPNKTRDTLLRSAIWYLEHFKNDYAKTVVTRSGEAAVELSFKLELDLPNPDGGAFLLCGHLDRVVQVDNAFWITDRKTTKNTITARYWQQFTPNNQMSLYYSAGQIVLEQPIRGIIIDAAQIGVGYTNFARHQVTRTPGMQDEWLRDTYTWIGIAMQYATEGYWPQNDKSCGNYGGCPFQPICSKDPKVRQTFMKHEGYHKRQWNPLVSR